MQFRSSGLDITPYWTMIPSVAAEVSPTLSVTRKRTVAGPEFEKVIVSRIAN